MRKDFEIHLLNDTFKNNCKDTKIITKALVTLQKVKNRFYYIGDKLNFVGADTIYPIPKSVDSLKIFCLSFLKEDELTYTYKDKSNKTKKIDVLNYKLLLPHLAVNKVSLVDYEVDFFAPENIIKTEKFVDGFRLNLVFNKFSIKKIELEKEITETQKIECLEDYKQHFPDLDLLLDFIISSRFAFNRKATYLHFKARSNWGKTFLMDALKTLNLAYEIRYSDIAENKAVAVNPLEVLDSICLILDEFKYFSKEMKKITTEMVIEPKYGFKNAVPVYGKILFSAEESESFKDGVDEQIANRVIVIDYSDTHKYGKLDDRKAYIKYGSYTYMQVVKHYISNYLQKKFNEFLALGKIKSSKFAEDYLIKLASKKRLKTEDLNNEIRRIFIEFFNKIDDLREDNKYKNIISNIHFNTQKDTIYITNTKKTVDDILKLETTQSFYAKAKYKISAIDVVFKTLYKNNRLPNKKVAKSIKINLLNFKLNYILLEQKINLVEKEIEFLNFDDLVEKINELLKDLKEDNLKSKIEILEEELKYWGILSKIVARKNKDNTEILGFELISEPPKLPDCDDDCPF